MPNRGGPDGWGMCRIDFASPCAAGAHCLRGNALQNVGMVVIAKTRMGGVDSL